MERVVGVLGAGQRLQLGDPDVHLLGRLGVRGVEELKGQAGDLVRHPRLSDDVGRRDVGDREVAAARDRDPARDEALGIAVAEQVAERVRRSSRHRVAGDDVLADRVLVEVLAGGDDRHAAPRHVLRVHDALDPAVVVDVRMGVDDRRDRLVADVLAEHAQALARVLHTGRAVDDDQPVVAFDDRQVPDVVVAHLVEAVDDLVQPAFADHLRLAPQARVDGVRGRRAVREVVELGEVEDHLALFVDDLLVGEVRDVPAVGVGEVLPVVHVVQSDRLAIRRGGGGRGVLRHRASFSLSIHPLRERSLTAWRVAGQHRRG